MGGGRVQCEYVLSYLAVSLCVHHLVILHVLDLVHQWPLTLIKTIYILNNSNCITNPRVQQCLQASKLLSRVPEVPGIHDTQRLDSQKDLSFGL